MRSLFDLQMSIKLPKAERTANNNMWPTCTDYVQMFWVVYVNLLNIILNDK